MEAFDKFKLAAKAQSDYFDDMVRRKDSGDNDLDTNFYTNYQSLIKNSDNAHKVLSRMLSFTVDSALFYVRVFTHKSKSSDYSRQERIMVDTLKKIDSKQNQLKHASNDPDFKHSLEYQIDILNELIMKQATAHYFRMSD